MRAARPAEGQVAPRVAQGARDRDEVVRCLRDGGDPNMICPDGWVKDECRPKDGDVGRSLLHHAAWAGDVGIFKLLVESGADVERKRNTAWRPHGGVRGRGSTPLHHACQYNRVPIVLYLLDELGCDINAPGEQGYTPLHLAATFNYPELVELLLRRGARTDMLTKDEKSARDLAGAKQERSHAPAGRRAHAHVCGRHVCNHACNRHVCERNMCHRFVCGRNMCNRHVCDRNMCDRHVCDRNMCNRPAGALARSDGWHARPLRPLRRGGAHASEAAAWDGLAPGPSPHPQRVHAQRACGAAGAHAW